MFYLWTLSYFQVFYCYEAYLSPYNSVPYHISSTSALSFSSIENTGYRENIISPPRVILKPSPFSPSPPSLSLPLSPASGLRGSPE